MYTEAELKMAHSFCRRNRQKLLSDTICGCFHCRKIFSPAEITDWLHERNATAYDDNDTARCPYCGVDAVIGGYSGYPIDDAFLEAMYKYWFS